MTGDRVQVTDDEQRPVRLVVDQVADTQLVSAQASADVERES